MKIKVQFFKGTKPQYDSISPDRYTFYFLTDTNQVYLGANQLTNDDIATIQSQILNINQELIAINRDINSVNRDINDINRDLISINQDIEDISQDIISINQEIDNIEENAVSILTVSEEDKQQIESEISKKDRFYLYIYDNSQESPDLKIGDGINYVADLPFICRTGSGGGGGEGLPSGGTTGQVLVKNSNTNYDVAWQTIRATADTYIHEQGVASDTWTITHNLDKYPSVSVVDTADTIVVGDVQYISRNSLTVKFIAPFKGKAYLN